MRRNERGAVAVEFALVVPLLVLLIAGIAEFGRAYYLQTTLSGSARDAVRVMALQDDPAAAAATARTAASPLALTSVAVTTCPTGTTCPSTGSTTTGNRCAAVAGSTLPPTATVTINYTTPFMTGFFGADLKLRATGVMLCGG